MQDVHNARLEKDPTLIVYVPYWRRPPFSGDIVVRSAIDPESLMPELRRRVWAIDSTVPIAQMRTIDDLVSEATAQRRFQMQIVLRFACAVTSHRLGIGGRTGGSGCLRPPGSRATVRREPAGWGYAGVGRAGARRGGRSGVLAAGAVGCAGGSGERSEVRIGGTAGSLWVGRAEAPAPLEYDPGPHDTT